MVLDIIGEILWFGMFFTPVITIPLALRYNKNKTKFFRVIDVLLLAILISVVFFMVSMSILFRDGLGPT